MAYEGELAGSILLEDGDGFQDDGSRPFNPYGGFGVGQMQPFFGAELGMDLPSPHQSPGASPGADSRRRRDAGEGRDPSRPARTPSPDYEYDWSAPKKIEIRGDADVEPSPARFNQAASSADDAVHGGFGIVDDPRVGGSAGAEANPYANPFMNPYWAGAASFNPQAQAQAQAYSQAMMMSNPLMMQNLSASLGANAQAHGGPLSGFSRGSAAPAAPEAKPSGPQGPPMEYMQMMMAMQAMQQAQAASMGASMAAAPGAGKGQSSSSNSLPGPAPAARGLHDESQFFMDAQAPSRGGYGGQGLGGGAGLGVLAGQPLAEAPGKRTKNRGGKGGDALVQRAPAPEAAVPKERGGKGERRRRGERGGGKGEIMPTGEEAFVERDPRSTGGGGGKAKGGGTGGDSRTTSNPIIEQLKSRERTVELGDLCGYMAEIAQDQYGSRLIQQKLEVANDEEKQKAFKAVLSKMPQLMCDVFGNYVIQKFFEYGNAEQRRILAEQLVGQVLKLSHQMYGCRVVQKALDSVPIEQQVLLIGELKGHVIRCIEDQHGNHVIQKCIERLPTDKIDFIVVSFDGQATRMAKHCYGCRVIQRLIEYCSSAQINTLLDEVLRNLSDLATDQYGNYVVQHVLEHSSRNGDRGFVLAAVRKHINLLSCHKYASNVVEKALSCVTYEERGAVIDSMLNNAEVHPHQPPILNMMKDRFGNYIVQKTIQAAQNPQRQALLDKLNEQMPSLKKSNTYGKHIISALERAQAQGQPP